MQPTKTLKPFQADDVRQFLTAGNCVCGHEPGVGKTAIGIGLIAGRTLIVVPKSVLYQYADEIQAFRPDISPIVVTGTPKGRKRLYMANLSSSAVILCTYESLRIDIGIISGLPAFDTLLFDEVHRLASTKTKTHKNIRLLLKSYRADGKVPPRIYGFTASLIMNSPMDIFGVYNILRPGLFPNYLHFTLEYMNRHPTFGYMIGAKQSKLAKLGEIISPVFFRRTLAEVAPQLPPHVDEIVKFDLSAKERKLYSDIRAELLLQILPKDIDLIKNPVGLQNALVKMCKLQELTDSADLIGHSEIPSTKFAILKEKLEELLTGNDRKCVVFSRFSRTINLLETFLAEYNPTKIIGDVTGEDRQANITKFKTDKTCRVLLCTVAGSEGISLEEAQYLIRLNSPFSVGRDLQLTGRIRRITSLEPTFSFTLVARKSIDERMIKILENKRVINETIFSWNDVKEMLDIPF